MINFQIVPHWMWFAICLSLLLVAALYAWWRRIEQARLRRHRQQRSRRIAIYKAWEWLNGKPKRLRLTDNRDRGD